MLTAGTRIGSYEVVSSLGKGGMGEVYRARDARLKRDVAIKILPGGLAGDTERQARFQREAEILAALDHPGIGGIHGLEDAGGGFALVLELVEGETLAERIARGPVPLDEALPIADQIAAALEYAHERGVVHRDLKPANIKITLDGTVKVLDFGLAKLSDDRAAPSGDASASPTMTAMSQAGMLLGTAAYMSPEQARGKPADRRSDVWAFGCVLYEMLTGRRAVEGQEVSDILAEVLKGTPDWTRLPPSTPPAVRRLLRRCLEKDRARRLPDIASARLEIADARDATEDVVAVVPERDRRRWLTWALAGTALAMAVLALLLWAPWQSRPTITTRPVEMLLGVDASLPGGSQLALSRDGATLVFAAIPRGESEPRLFVRRLADQLEATPLSGTEGAASPFFSPDGRWIGFHARGALRKVAATGGAPITVASGATAGQLGGAWTERDTIIFAASPGPLFEVPADGGTPVAVTTLVAGEATHVFPHALPGGTAVLFGAAGSPADPAPTLSLQRLSSGERRTVMSGAVAARFLPTGHLLYMDLDETTLFATPFDPAHPERTQPGGPVQEGVATAQFVVSDTGDLVYARGASFVASVRNRPLLWLDRSGATTSIRSEFPGGWGTPRFAPSGDPRLALTIIQDGSRLDIWTLDLERDTLLDVTQGEGQSVMPVWALNGRRLVFGSRHDDVTNLYWRRADATGEIQRLTDSPSPQVPGSWHPTRNVLVFTEGDPSGPQRIMLLEVEGDEASGWRPGEPIELIGGRNRNAVPTFSPDGNWLAYASLRQTGTWEIYVRPFPGGADAEEVKISDGGGYDPVWSRTRNEILFSTLADSATGRVMVAPYTIAGGQFLPGRPAPLHDAVVSVTPILSTVTLTGQYMDLHPDGERMAVAMAPTQATDDAPARPATVILIQNFVEDLRRRMPRR